MSTSHLCTFSGEHIRSCMLATGSNSNGIESKLWSFGMQKIAIDIIRKQSPFKYHTYRELRKLFENCFVPILQTFKVHFNTK